MALATWRSGGTRKAVLAVSEPSAYLTDGRRLLRVVRGFTEPTDESFALLEDCRTLETHAFTPDELWELRVELVRRSPPPAARGAQPPPRLLS